MDGVMTSFSVETESDRSVGRKKNEQSGGSKLAGIYLLAASVLHSLVPLVNIIGCTGHTSPACHSTIPLQKTFILYIYGGEKDGTVALKMVGTVFIILQKKRNR